MIIENKVDALIVAINELTVALQGTQTVTATESAAIAPAQVTQAVSIEELQLLCTQIVRADRTKKAGIVAILAGYKAKLISDIPVHHYARIKENLEALNV